MHLPTNIIFCLKLPAECGIKGAITDLQKASELFQQQRKIAEYQYTLKLIQQIKNR